MRNRFTIHALLALCLAGAPLMVHAGDAAPNVEYDFQAAEAKMRPICAGVRDVQPPPGDLPTPAQARQLADCSSSDLFFGIGVPRDPAKARLCAFVEKAHGDEWIWGGSTILMMVYANGEGAKRNLDYAIKLACDNDLAPGGGQAFRVVHLDRLRREHWHGHNFHVCTDTTSGYWEGACTMLSTQIVQARRDARLAHILAGWSPADRRAFASLKRAFDAFVKARVDNEVDLSGTARSAFQFEEESFRRKAFLERIERLQRGKLPHYSAAEFAAADRALNAMYRKVMKVNEAAYSTITHAGIRKTERAWLAYRDAWVAFGRKKFPQVSAESWKSVLTRERTRMLKDVM